MLIGSYVPLGIVLSTHPHRIALWIDVKFVGIL